MVKVGSDQGGVLIRGGTHQGGVLIMQHLNPDRIEGKIKQMACGRGHYALLDSKNQLHVFGKVLKEKAEEEHDGFGVYDGNDLFDEGEVLDLQMKYETFGALVKNA